MAGFYRESESSSLLIYLKAGALEGAIVLFSFTSHKKTMHQILYKFIAVGICILSIYGMCSKQLGIGLELIESRQMNSKEISDVENSIVAKSAQRNYLFSHGWITAARKTESTIDGLRLKLEHLRTTALQLKSVQAVTHSTIIQVLLRVFLMLANILAVHRLGEISRKMKRNPFESSGRYIRTLKSDLGISSHNLKISRFTNTSQKSDSGAVIERDFNWLLRCLPLREKGKI